MQDHSIQLIARWREGDEDAAAEIFERYAARLIALAASRISPKLQRRIEAEDVVQSVYRSFFGRASDARLSIDEPGRLWSLLAAITINKVRAQARFHGAAKRDMQAEASMTASLSCHGLPPEELASEPTAEEATELAEQYKLALSKLGTVGQQVFELHLANESVQSIAKQVRRSERTVRRELETIRKLLEGLLSS